MNKATSNLVRFENKIIAFYLRLEIALAYCNAGVIVLNSEVIGSAPVLEEVLGNTV
jgi:hypothetical protein